MKAEKVMFVNGHGFKEYAVRFKRSALSPWEWFTDHRGRPMLLSDAMADAAIETLKNG